MRRIALCGLCGSLRSWQLHNEAAHVQPSGCCGVQVALDCSCDSRAPVSDVKLRLVCANSVVCNMLSEISEISELVSRFQQEEIRSRARLAATGDNILVEEFDDLVVRSESWTALART